MHAIGLDTVMLYKHMRRDAVYALHPILAFSSFSQFSSPHAFADDGLDSARTYPVEGDGSNSVSVVMRSHTSYDTAKSASAHA